MHFCPRANCTRWFHESCLLGGGHTDRIEYTGSPELRRVAIDPDVARPHKELVRFLWAKPPHGKLSTSLDELPPAWEMLAALIHVKHGPALPRSLLEIATMPILRRAGADDGFSTAGNVQDVLLARRMLYQRLDRGFKDFYRLERRLPPGVNWWLTDWYDRVWGALSVQRMLASPRVAYWDQRRLELAEHEPRPSVHCPRCSAEGKYHVPI